MWHFSMKGKGETMRFLRKAERISKRIACWLSPRHSQLKVVENPVVLRRVFNLLSWALLHVVEGGVLVDLKEHSWVDNCPMTLRQLGK